MTMIMGEAEEEGGALVVAYNNPAAIGRLVL